MDAQARPSEAKTITSGSLIDSEFSGESNLLLVGDAAKFLAISKRTLQQLTADRQIAVVRFGRNVRYDIGDLRRFADSRKVREIGWKPASKQKTSGLSMEGIR